MMDAADHDIWDTQCKSLCENCEHHLVCKYQPEFEAFMKNALYLNGMATPDYIEFKITCRWYKETSPTMRHQRGAVQQYSYLRTPKSRLKGELDAHTKRMERDSRRV